MRENGMGDVRIIKGGLLAWKLYRHIWNLDGKVVDHWINIGLGVYRKRSNKGGTLFLTLFLLFWTLICIS